MYLWKVYLKWLDAKLFGGWAKSKGSIQGMITQETLEQWRNAALAVDAIKNVVKQFYTPSDQDEILNPERIRYANIQNAKKKKKTFPITSFWTHIFRIMATISKRISAPERVCLRCCEMFLPSVSYHQNFERFRREHKRKGTFVRTSCFSLWQTTLESLLTDTQVSEVHINTQRNTPFCYPEWGKSTIRSSTFCLRILSSAPYMGARTM